MSKKISALPTYSDPLSSVAYVPTVIDGSTYKFDINELQASVEGADINPNSVGVTTPADEIASVLNYTYGTFTSSTNFERITSKYNSNTISFQLGTEKGSAGGTAKPLDLIVDGITKLQVETGDTLRSSSKITLFNSYESSVSINTSTGVITTPETHNWKSGDVVFITASVLPTGLAADTRYYVRDVTSTTFKLSATSGGVAITPSSTGTSVIIVSNNKVKRPGNLVLGCGNYISSYNGGVDNIYGCGTTIIGNNNNYNSFGTNDANVNSGIPKAFIFGSSNTVGGGFGDIIVAGRQHNVQGGFGNSFSCFGDSHLGGSAGGFFKGGFHSLMNSVGTTDLSSTGAENSLVGSGTALTGAGGLCIGVTGNGAHGYWQAFETFQSHGNKDKGFHNGTLSCNSNNVFGPLANGGTRTDELFTMLYPPLSSCIAASGVNTGTDVFTASIAIANDTPVRVTATQAIPDGLSIDTTYYVVNSSGLTFKLSATLGGAAIDITSTGTGIIHFISPTGNTKWLRLFPNKIYNFEFNCIVLLSSATTPTYAVMKRRATYYQAAVGVAPTLVGSVQTVDTDVGSNAGAIPAGWSLNINPATDGIHVSVTVVNNDGTARNIHANCKVECLEVNTI